MTRSIRRIAAAVALSGSLVAFSAAAQAYSAEQQRLCTGDAFRLCSAEIPDIDRITTCMRRQKAQLSTGCRSVFDK